METDCFVGRTEEVTVRFLSGRMSFTVMYSMSTFSDLWISVDGMLVLTNVHTPPLGLSVRSARCISISLDGESVRAVEMGLLDAADVDYLRFRELLKFKFLLSHPFCIPMHDAKCLVTGSSTLSSPGHQKRIRAAVSRIGWALLRLRARRRPTLVAAHQDDTTTIQR